MIPEEVAKTLHLVPEEVIIEFEEQARKFAGINNNFTKLMKAAAKFKHAGATPIFLATPDGSAYTVSSEETYQKRLH